MKSIDDPLQCIRYQFLGTDMQIKENRKRITACLLLSCSRAYDEEKEEKLQLQKRRQ
jgi:hypothetical protein